MTTQGTPQRYLNARETFTRFKQELEHKGGVRTELLEAIGLLVADYNTTYRENRFIVGGAVEEMMAAAMRCVGLEQVRCVGVANIGCDIFVGDRGFSLKTSFTGRNEAIGMINKQGGGSPKWEDPTIFVLAGAGIGYADPHLLPNATQDRSDQIALPRPQLYSFFQRNPEWQLQCEVPVKPPTDEPPKSVASKSVAVEILGRKEPDRGTPLFRILSTGII
jgi:hypothetical protein